MEYKEKILKDTFEFLQLIGGENELAERGWKNSDIMDETYKEKIEDLFIHWLPDESNEIEINSLDDYLHIEDLLYGFFESELKEMIGVE